VNRDGTGFARLTKDPAKDWSPVWSPDGMRIAFSTNRFGREDILAVMDADGSRVSPIGASIPGWPRSWSPDGTQIALTAVGDPSFCGRSPGDGGVSCYIPLAIDTTTPDGAAVTRLGNFLADPAWKPMRVPVATYTSVCNSKTCTFDASGSKDLYGTI